MILLFIKFKGEFSMSQQEVKIHVADPTAFGVLGLAMITFVASTSKLGWTGGTSLLIPVAFFLGAFMQVIASMLDFKKGNYFGATVLGAYGFFWFAVAFEWAILGGMFGPEIQAAMDPKQLGYFFFGYFIFSFFVMIASFETNVPFMGILILIEVLLFALSMGSWGIGDKAMWGQLAGWSEFGIAVLGFYATGAIFFKNFYGREILPLGKPLNLIKKAAPAPAPAQKISA